MATQSISPAGPARGSSLKKRAGQFAHTFFARWPVRFAFVIICVMVFIALFSPLVSRYDPNTQELVNALQSPSGEHLLGTDALGRDVLARIIYGSRTSLAVGFVSTVLAGCAGMAIGLAAGYLGGVVDTVVMRVMDAMMSIPIIILALFLGSVLGNGLFNVMLCLGIVMIPSYARVTRGQVMSVKQLDYITASKISGGTQLKTALKHILPNCLSPNLVLMTMNLGNAILTEASLSFLGMGVTPPTPTWGAMVSDGYKYLSSHPVLAMVPGLFIMLTVWAFNVAGDALRDALDPRLKGAL